MLSSLTDPAGRRISYLRVSVTDRCDMRCTYCMAERMTFLPRSDVLDYDELLRLCRVFVQHGVRRLRITGGEPLVRRDIGPFFRSWAHGSNIPIIAASWKNSLSQPTAAIWPSMRKPCLMSVCAV